MRTRRFPSRTEAEDFLKGEGFVFQGAPNRWRKQEGGRILHADVLIVKGAAVVVVTSLASGESGAAADDE